MTLKPKTFTLRDYQNWGVDYLLEDLPNNLVPVLESRWKALIVATAGGKTKILNAAAKLASENPNIKGVLLITPHLHISQTFQGHEVYRYTKPGDLNPVVVEVTSSFWGDSLQGKSRIEKVHSFQDFLQTGGRRSTSHAQSIRWDEFLTMDLTGYLLIIDEGHHPGEDNEGSTRIYDFAHLWYQRGGFVWTATATQTRSDGRRIFPDEAEVVPFVISYTYLAANQEWGFPKHILHRVCELAENDRPNGKLLPDDYVKVSEYIVEVGRPTLLVIPPGREGHSSTETAKLFVDALVDAGIHPDSILNAVGMEDYIKHYVTHTLDRERRAGESEGFLGLKTQVIISCRRFQEGSDWPAANHIVDLGMSTSIVAIIQKLGRILRSKLSIAGYPTDWLDNVIYTTVIPKFREGSDEELTLMKQLVIQACFLDCSDAAYDYMRFWKDLVCGLRLPPVAKASSKFRMLTQLGLLQPEEEHEAKKKAFEVNAALRILFGKTPTLKEMSEMLTAGGPEFVHALRVLVQDAAESDPELREAFVQGFHGVFNDIVTEFENAQSEIDLRRCYDDALLVHLTSIANQFGHLVVSYDQSLLGRSLEVNLSTDLVKEIVLEMTSARNEVYEQLGNAPYVVTQIIEPYFQKYKHYPDVDDPTKEQDVSEFVGFRATLSDVNRALQRQNLSLSTVLLVRSWIVGPTLTPQTFQVLRGVRLPPVDSSLWMSSKTLLKTLSKQMYNAQRYFRRSENFLVLEMAARYGWRGLPGGQSLAEVITIATEEVV